jgi:hypothetical protein
MGILELFFIIVVIGVVVWAICKWVPMDGDFKTAIKVVGLLVVVLIVLEAFGIFAHFHDVAVPRV